MSVRLRVELHDDLVDRTARKTQRCWFKPEAVGDETLILNIAKEVGLLAVLPLCGAAACRRVTLMLQVQLQVQVQPQTRRSIVPPLRPPHTFLAAHRLLRPPKRGLPAAGAVR
jgi:hypothetical protein